METKKLAGKKGLAINKVAKAQKRRVGKQSTGLPPSGSGCFDIKVMECLDCGYLHKGEEIEALQDSVSKKASKGCLHCGFGTRFKLYNEDGDYIPDGQREDFLRDRSEIEAKAGEYFDRVGHERNLRGSSSPEDLARSTERYRRKYGNLPEDFDEWDRGYWNGQLAALR